MEASAAIAAEIARIAEKLKVEGPFGAVSVVAVAGELTTDHDGDSVLRLRMTLSDPPGRDATWPLRDVHALQQASQRLAREAHVELPYVVTEFYPVSPDAEEDTEDGSGEELSRALDPSS